MVSNVQQIYKIYFETGILYYPNSCYFSNTKKLLVNFVTFLLQLSRNCDMNIRMTLGDVVMIQKFLKILVISFFMPVLLLITSASAQEKEVPKFKVVTTFTIIADMARHVAGDAAEVVSITKPGAEIHRYQPTPGDLIKAQDAQLILWNGLNLELWFEKFFQNLKDVPSVTVSDGVIPIGITEGPYMQKPNPHAWMSSSSAMIYIDNIRDALVKYDPEHAEIYKVNAENYKAEVRLAIEPLRAKLSLIPEEKRWLVTSEGAFSYLARDFGLKELYLWPINADQQGTPKQIRQVIDTMRKHKIDVIFSESTVSSTPAKQIARETGARYGGVLYVDSLTERDGNVPTYIDLLKVTTSRIIEGIGQ